MPTVWDHILVVCVTSSFHPVLFWYPRFAACGAGAIQRARRHATESILVQLWVLVETPLP
jgi:hypothetical protein